MIKIDISKIKMRQIGTDEVDVLTSYRMAYLEEMQEAKDAHYRDLLQAELSDYFDKAINENRVFAFLAEQDDQPLSFGAMVLKKIPGDFNQPIYLEGDILNMYTVPFARQKGISAMILQELLNEARKRGVSKVSLHTTKDGEKLYRKFGFSEPVFPVLELCL